MTRSKLRKIRRNQAKTTRVFLTGVPLASAMLVGAPVVQAQQAEEQQRPRRSRRYRAQNPAKPAGRAGQHPAIGTERLEELNISSLTRGRTCPACRINPRVLVARVFMRARRRQRHHPVRSWAWVNISMSSPSPRSRARRHPCTTSRASRRWQACRARCTAPACSRAPSASSPTSQTSRLHGGFSLEGNTIADGDPPSLAEGANIPSAKRRDSPVGWVRHDGGYIDNVAATAPS